MIEGFFVYHPTPALEPGPSIILAGAYPGPVLLGPFPSYSVALEHAGAYHPSNRDEQPAILGSVGFLAVDG